MNKTRKILATLTMVAVATTASLSTVSSAQAHITFFPHPHIDPGVVTMPVPGLVAPVPGPVLPTPATPAPPRRRGGLRSGEAAALGVLGGILIGGMLAGANRRPAQPVQPAALPAAHYAYCDAKYRSYVIATDSYTGYDGYQHRCNSPYVY
jgi:hypothetical protein